jgi:hypothetical protein
LPRQNDSHKAKELRLLCHPIIIPLSFLPVLDLSISHNFTCSCKVSTLNIYSSKRFTTPNSTLGKPRKIKMCYQRIEKYSCSHITRYKPYFCRYRFNINHQIEPQITYAQELCKDCLARKTQDLSADFCGHKVNGESRIKIRELGADERGEGVTYGD